MMTESNSHRGPFPRRLASVIVVLWGVAVMPSGRVTADEKRPAAAAAAVERGDAAAGANRQAFVGLITARTLEIKAERPGTVQAVQFAEGQAVKQGQILVQLDDTVERLRVDAAQAELEKRKVELKRVQ